jgi:hypothetical protein
VNFFTAFFVSLLAYFSQHVLLIAQQGLPSKQHSACCLAAMFLFAIAAPPIASAAKVMITMTFFIFELFFLIWLKF